jgi:hypothetical protein
MRQHIYIQIYICMQSILCLVTLIQHKSSVLVNTTTLRIGSHCTYIVYTISDRLLYTHMHVQCNNIMLYVTH